jgi:hypothetical protein
MKHEPSRNETCTAFLARQGIIIPAGTELSVRCKREGEPQNEKGTAWRPDTYFYTAYDYWIDSQEAADKPSDWPLEVSVHSIGWTGRNYLTGESMHAGFDFDAMTGHAQGVGVADNELDRVKAAALELPYVEARLSTSGGGVHLYAMFSGIVSAAPHELPHIGRRHHKAVARAALQKMSFDTDFDFRARLDVLGGNMWAWSVRSTPQNRGLTIIKPHTARLTEADIPNWRDHIDVVAGRSSKIVVRGYDPTQHTADNIPLDAEHRRIMGVETGYTSRWVPDHNLWQTHTGALTLLIEQGHAKGIFRTTSKCSDRGTPNCYLFPRENGSFVVYRFGGAVSEAETWSTNDRHTYCTFNAAPDLGAACKANGGVKDPIKGGFVFDMASNALLSAKMLGAAITLPEKLMHRETRLAASKEGNLIAFVELREGDAGMEGWLAKKDQWVREYDVKVVFPRTFRNLPVRVLVTPEHEEAGIVVLSKAGTWDAHGAKKVEYALQARGLTSAQARVAIGEGVLDRYKLVNVPFAEEYLPGKQWNRDAAQYKVAPTSGEHPTWDELNQHCGQSLTPAIDQWCREHGILSGAQYLMHWAAHALRHPYEPLPYLLFYGPENSGKSSWHEALELLVTGGVSKVDRALTCSSGYNGELENCIFGVVSEVDLSMSSVARNRLKELVTAKRIAIRKMRTNVYHVVSTLHLIQTANDASYGNVPDGDTRVVVIFVPKAPTRKKEEFFAALEREAPHYLHTLLNLELASTDRLRLPVLRTKEKDAISSPLRDYIEARLVIDEKAKVAKTDVYDDYKAWCGDDKTPAKDTVFGRWLNTYMEARHLFFSTDAKIGPADNRKNAYQGIKIKLAE